MARTPTASPSPHAGITLVEVIVCTCVFSILAAIATPAMAGLIERQRAIAAENMLVTHLALTRMTAITHRSLAVMCPSSDGATCDAGTDWSGGWLLFLDRDGNRRPDQPEHILRSDRMPIPRNLRLVSSTGRPQVRYLADGRSAGTNLTISVCNTKGDLLASVIVNSAGRTRSTWPAKPTSCPA